MASINTSELQFAFTFFAKFNELYNYSFNKIIVPSTILEGKDAYEYNGADLVLDQFFFQFKISNLLTGANAGQASTISRPYFRIDIKNSPTELSTRGQLDFLIDHSKNPTRNNKVFYVAPSFDQSLCSHLPTNRRFWYKLFYQSAPGQINDYCAFIDISSIDPSWVLQNDAHKLCFRHGESFGYLFSEPQKIKILKPVFPDYNLSEIQFSNLQSIDEIIAELNNKLVKLIPEEQTVNKKENKLQKLQRILFQNFNTMWLPLIIKKEDATEITINKILNQ